MASTVSAQRLNRWFRFGNLFRVVDFQQSAVVGGSPRKLGDIAGQDGAWSADGKFIAYSNGNSLFTAKADGTDARKVITVGDSGFVFTPVWSPDGN